MPASTLFKNRSSKRPSTSKPPSFPPKPRFSRSIRNNGPATSFISSPTTDQPLKKAIFSSNATRRIIRSTSQKPKKESPRARSPSPVPNENSLISKSPHFARSSNNASASNALRNHSLTSRAPDAPSRKKPPVSVSIPPSVRFPTTRKNSSSSSKCMKRMA